jgi:hypothetical protein
MRPVNTTPKCTTSSLGGRTTDSATVTSHLDILLLHLVNLRTGRGASTRRSLRGLLSGPRDPGLSWIHSVNLFDVIVQVQPWKYSLYRNIDRWNQFNLNYSWYILTGRVSRKSDKPATGYDSGYNEDASRKSSPNRQANSVGSPKSSPRSAQEWVWRMTKFYPLCCQNHNKLQLMG